MKVTGFAALEKQPNFLVIEVDDFGYSDVSWNNPAMVTPELEKLARAGVILDTFYSAPRSSPSRAALLTGLYPYKLGIQRGNVSPFRPYGLASRFKLLPEMLKERGYSTHLVGKWHLGYCNETYLPTRRGYDTFFGHYTEQVDHFTRRLDKEETLIGSGYDLRRGEEVSEDGAGLYSSDLWAKVEKYIIRFNALLFSIPKESEDLLETLKVSDEDSESQSPWYLQVSFTGAAAPFQVPDKYLAMYEGQKVGKKDMKRKLDRGRKHEMEIRRAMITAVDEAVGKIIEKLQDIGSYNNTVIIFLSDNGSPMPGSGANQPFRGMRGTLEEGGVRVPAFISSPLLAPDTRGSRVKEMVHVTDILPTLLSLASEDVEGVEEMETDGFNIWDAIQQRKPFERDTVVINLDIDDQSPNFQFAVRVGPWKLFWGQPDRLEVNQGRLEHVEVLYKIDKDLRENRDLAWKHPEKVAELKGLIYSLVKDMKPSYQPNRSTLAFPRYNEGLVRPGWCSADWDLTLWRELTAWDEVLERLEHDPDYIDFVVDTDYNHSY